jgi:hypothetical protein
MIVVGFFVFKMVISVAAVVIILESFHMTQRFSLEAALPRMEIRKVV